MSCGDAADATLGDVDLGTRDTFLSSQVYIFCHITTYCCVLLLLLYGRMIHNYKETAAQQQQCLLAAGCLLRKADTWGEGGGKNFRYLLFDVMSSGRLSPPVRSTIDTIILLFVYLDWITQT